MEHKLNYHDLPGLSHSRLKLLRKDPKLFQMAMEEGWSEESKNHHIEGDMIDKLLLDYPSFEASYIEQTWVSPASAQQEDFCQQVSSGMSPESAYSNCYKTKLNPDALKNTATKLYDTLELYINYLKESKEHFQATGIERIPYSSAHKEMIMAIQKNSLAHPFVANLLNHEHKETHKVLKANLFGEPFKCEIDLYIDQEDVVWNVDVKSSKDSLSYFPYSYRKWGYQNQQALYYKLIREHLKSQGRGHVPIRTICIGVSKVLPYSVLAYEISPRLLVQGWQWIKESVELYKFHKKRGFEYPKSTYENGIEYITPYGL